MNFGQSSRIVTVFLRIFVNNGPNHRGLGHEIQSPTQENIFVTTINYFVTLIELY